MDLDTLHSIQQLNRQLTGKAVDQQKAIMAQFLRKYVPYSSIAWATRKDFSGVTNAEQTFCNGYHPQQFRDYAKCRPYDSFLGQLFTHTDTVMTLREVFDPDQAAANHPLLVFMNSYQIVDCLGMFVDSQGTQLSHIISLHWNNTEQRFSEQDKARAQAILPILCQIMDSCLLRDSVRYWIFDLVGSPLQQQNSRIPPLLQADGEGYNQGDFYLVPKDSLLEIFAPLSPSENEVAQLVLSGLSNKAIAKQLDKSSNTVAKQVTAIFAKLNVPSRSAFISKLSTAL